MNKTISDVSRKTPMHIALLLPRLDIGGAQHVILNLARGFSARGIRVDLVVAQAIGPLLGEIPPGVSVINLQSSRTIWSLPQLVKYLKSARPESLLVTNTNFSFIALVACKVANVATRVIVRQGVSVSFYKSRFGQSVVGWLVGQLYPKANVILAVSQGIADELTSWGHVPPERVHVIPSPIVPRNIRELATLPTDHPWFTPKTLPVILGAGRLEKEKDFATLVRAFSLAQGILQSRLIILGDGAERHALLALIRKLGLVERVDLPGFVTNPFSYMSRASVFVLSSLSEGFPAVLLQALACGVPVVATNCKHGPREILQNGKLGKLVPVGDERAMATALLESSQNFGTGADPEVWQNYSYDRAIDAYIYLL